MGLISRILRKYYPHLMKYDKIISWALDILFILAFVFWAIAIQPEIVYVCNGNIVENFTAFNFTNFTIP